MLATTAYFVRGLQILLGSSKRAMTERAEEMGTEDDDIPLAQRTRTASEVSQATTVLSLQSLSIESRADLTIPSPAQDPSHVRGTGGPPVVQRDAQQVVSTTTLRQDPLPLTRAQKWAAIVNVNLDIITYGFIFLFIGLPIYYSTGYAMPLQLALNVLAYFAALALPARWRRFLHPVLVSSVITIVGIWVLALFRHDSLRGGLRVYSTKTRYLQLWDGQKNSPRPGAGDVFGSVLDVSIVALALPMFQYRKELKRHVSRCLGFGHRVWEHRGTHRTEPVLVSLHYYPQHRHLHRLPFRIPSPMLRDWHFLAPKPLVRGS